MKRLLIFLRENWRAIIVYGAIVLGCLLFLAYIYFSIRDAKRSYDEEIYYEGYGEGYDDGHDEGYDKGYDDGHDEGYDEGYDDGHDDVYDFELDEIIYEELISAAHFVREDADFHPEEALAIIELWRDGERTYGNLVLTEEIYQEAITSLCRFYEYFYDGHYR